VAVARRKAKSTCFVALHEPFDRKPALSIRRMRETGAAIGVSVRGPEFTDYACVSFDGEPHELVDAADAAQFFALRNYAYLRVKRGKIIARGEWLSFRIAAPGAAGAGALTLNGRAAPYRKQGDYLLFNSDAAPPRVLTAPAAPLPRVPPIAAAPAATRPRPTAVTIAEDNRHPLFPMWVVRAPGYEMRIHRKSGVSRTLIGPDGQLLFGKEWWGGSGFFEVRLPTGAEETAPVAWNHPARELRWRDQTLEVTATSGESFTATFGPHAIRYRFHGKTGVDYRASMQSFFHHTSGRVRSAKDQPNLPATLAGFHWTYHQNPALSPACAVLLTPREPATWSFSPASAAAYWTIRDGDQFLLLFASEKEIEWRTAAALGGKPK
jgi:hypothetical protein